MYVAINHRQTKKNPKKFSQYIHFVSYDDFIDKMISLMPSCQLCHLQYSGGPDDVAVIQQFSLKGKEKQKVLMGFHI